MKKKPPIESFPLLRPPSQTMAERGDSGAGTRLLEELADRFEGAATLGWPTRDEDLLLAARMLRAMASGDPAVQAARLAIEPIPGRSLDVATWAARADRLTELMRSGATRPQAVKAIARAEGITEDAVRKSLRQFEAGRKRTLRLNPSS